MREEEEAFDRLLANLDDLDDEEGTPPAAPEMRHLRLLRIAANEAAPEQLGSRDIFDRNNPANYRNTDSNPVALQQAHLCPISLVTAPRGGLFFTDPKGVPRFISPSTAYDDRLATLVAETQEIMSNKHVDERTKRVLHSLRGLIELTRMPERLGSLDALYNLRDKAGSPLSSDDFPLFKLPPELLEIIRQHAYNPLRHGMLIWRAHMALHTISQQLGDQRWQSLLALLNPGAESSQLALASSASLTDQVAAAASTAEHDGQ